MEKIIFFALVIPILGFVLYLGATAIMKGFSAKSANKTNENIEIEKIEETLNEENKLSDEIEKLNKLLSDGVLTQEEFETANLDLMSKIYYRMIERCELAHHGIMCNRESSAMFDFFELIKNNIDISSYYKQKYKL